MKKPEPGDNASMQTMQIDAVGDLEGIQLDDNEAADAPESMPPASVGRAMPPPLPPPGAQPPPGSTHAGPQARASASPPAKNRNAVIFGLIFVLAAIGITAGLMLGSALRGPAPVSAAPSVAPVAPAPPPVVSAAPPPPAADSVMRLDTIEVRDPPADPPKK